MRVSARALSHLGSHTAPLLLSLTVLPLFAGSEAKAPIESPKRKRLEQLEPSTKRQCRVINNEKWIEQLKASAKREYRLIDNHGGAGALVLGQPGVLEKLRPCLSVDQIAEACRSNPLSLMVVEGVSGLVPAGVTARVISEIQTLLSGIQRNLDGCEGSSDAWSDAVEQHGAEQEDATLNQYEQDEEQRWRDEFEARWHAYGEAESDLPSTLSAR